MRLMIPATIILCAAGCGGGVSDIPDLPPISLSGGGASLMTAGKTPEEAYDNAYSRLHSYHVKLRPFLTARDPNVLGVHETLKQIVDSLQTMQALTVDPWKKDLQPHIEWYASYFGTTLPSGGFLDEAARRLQQIKSNFNPSVVDIIAAFPDKPSDGATVPAPESQPASEPKPEAPKPKQPKPAAASSDTPLWMLYSAWKQAHNELADAYARGADCERPYQRAREAVAAMKARYPEERAKKLTLCDGLYEQQHEDTQGFKTLPEGAKREDVTRVLELVARTMAEYDPEKK